ncbi:MAG: MBL fold metallo-hydrolase [Chloroflexota bacterium]
MESGLTGIGTQPEFAIGQRALLVQTANGNVLWDCISLLDDATVGAVQVLGGIAAIAISHPHFYSSMVEWSRAFNAPIYLHLDARRWVMRPDAAIHWWEGDTRSVITGLTLVRCGGHFASSTVLHWADGADGRGALLTGDTISVARDRRYVTFMRSYPNLIPLPAAAVQRIAAAVEPFPFDRLYGGWWDSVVAADAKTAVARSAARYTAALEHSR